MRKTFLIDGKGRIDRIWPKVSVPGHAVEVLPRANCNPLHSQPNGIELSGFLTTSD
jgi:hypothetical protein